jgi:antitoxin (DNA-binding transcriptional repressor) of toxin-antitoxin stability system
MKPVITVTDAVRNFADFINRVVYRREEFVLERGGRRVAQLVPVPEGRRLGELPDILETIPRLEAEDAEAFARELDLARDELPRISGEGPWGS